MGLLVRFGCIPVVPGVHPWLPNTSPRHCAAHKIANVFDARAPPNASFQRCRFIQQGSPDVLVGGPPCQPYTFQRGDRKATTATDHHQFDRIFGASDSYMQCLRASRPKIAVLEEVKGFLAIPHNSSISPYTRFVREATAIPLDTFHPSRGPLYVSSRAFLLDAQTWLSISRPRVFVILFSDAAGGERAAESVEEAMGLIHAYRSSFPAVSPQDLFEQSGLNGTTLSRGRVLF
jgi:site-specific DNA-cytosine methylase